MSQVARESAARSPKVEPPVILRAKGIRKVYQLGEEELAVLKDVDLTLRQGEFVAIEGRSGSGKSTLLHIMGGLDTPQGGTVEFQGRDYTPQPAGMLSWGPLRWMKEFSPVTRMMLPLVLLLLSVMCYEIRPPTRFGTIFLAEICAIFAGICLFCRWERKLWRVAIWAMAVELIFAFPGHEVVVAILVVSLRVAAALAITLITYLIEQPISNIRNNQFGFVFQFYHLLPELSVLENTLVSPLIERNWVSYRFHQRELMARATMLLQSLGLGERMKHKPNQLSGGERQRVAIARALMNNPKVLFADEPTGNLDFETGRQIMDVLEKLHREQGQTIVMVTHDRTLAREADRVMVLKNGKLEKAGDAGE